MIDDRYQGGALLRRWSLLAGQPVCLLDAVRVDDVPPATVEAIEAENARIRTAVEAVEAYEAALLVVAQERPDPTIPGEDGPIPNPALAIWDAAKALADNPGASVLALHARRTGTDLEEDETRPDPVLVALVRGGLVQLVQWYDADAVPTEDAEGRELEAVPLNGSAPSISATWDGEDFGPAPAALAPVQQEIPLRQLLFALRDQGWITHAEALAAAKTGAMPATMVTALSAALTPEQLDDAELTWAAMYSAVRSDPLWQVFVATGTATEAQIDSLFRGAVA